jgi:hypothetical protein
MLFYPEHLKFKADPLVTKTGAQIRLGIRLLFFKDMNR